MAARDKRWSARVTRTSHALTLESGVFRKRSPLAIARSLKASATRSRHRKGTPLQSAMSMLDFYINRMGSQLSPARRRASSGRRRICAACSGGPPDASRMPRRPAAASPLPSKDDIDRCRRCDLGARATQGVAGEGDPRASLMLVGEQPGDQEDRQGLPFVGPSGQLLRRLIAEAGIGAHDFYLTNAVKHFSFEMRGIRRIHKTPTQREVAACHDWLEAEIAAVRPRVIVALGATALRALTGKATTIATAQKSPPTHGGGAPIVATFHPSALLRAPDEAARKRMRDAVVDALRRARGMAGG